MKKIKGCIFANVTRCLMSAVLLLAGMQAHAQLAVSDPVEGRVTVIEGSAWVRLLPNGMAAGYMTLNNSSPALVDLVSASSLKYYGRVAIHESLNEGGVSRMRKIEALPLPAHSQVALAPGGYHLMLLHPKQKVVPGNQVTLFLTFSSGQTLKVVMPVRKATGAH